MTAYDLFKRTYSHYSGNFIGHLVDGQFNPKDYIKQTFNETLDEYSVDYACSTGIMLVYGNPPDKKIEDLRSIEVQAGYWLCYYDGHTGDWMLGHYDNKADAKAAYKQLYSRYFRHQTWLWTVKIG